MISKTTFQILSLKIYFLLLIQIPNFLYSELKNSLYRKFCMVVRLPLAIWKLDYGAGSRFIRASSSFGLGGLVLAQIVAFKVHLRTTPGSAVSPEQPTTDSPVTSAVLIFQRENDLTGADKFKLVFAFGGKKSPIQITFCDG